MCHDMTRSVVNTVIEPRGVDCRAHLGSGETTMCEIEESVANAGAKRQHECPSCGGSWWEHVEKYYYECLRCATIFALEDDGKLRKVANG